MPIYDYRCQPCNRDVQVFCDFEERDGQRCGKCDSSLDQMVSVFASTPARWGDSHGYFDRGLGCHVANSMERERIMKERNLRPVSQQELDDAQQSSGDDHARHEREVATFSSALKETGDFATAAARTFPDQREPDPETEHRKWRYGFEKPWEPCLEVFKPTPTEEGEK